MNRILSILTLLLTFIGGAWAQEFTVASSKTNYNALQAGHYYAFRECQNNQHYLNGASNKTGSVEAGQIYKIVAGANSTIKLQCFADETYLALGDSKSGGYNVAMTDNAADAVEFTLTKRTNDDQVVLECYPNGGSTKHWLGAQSATSAYPAHFQSSGTGALSYWSVFEVTFGAPGAPEAKEITTYESATSCLMTIDPNFLALAGTGAHFAAAMASYPEYSCNPSGSHSVVANQVGGISNDVLNVAKTAPSTPTPIPATPRQATGSLSR